jgi:hypothetical protein
MPRRPCHTPLDQAMKVQKVEGKEEGDERPSKKMTIGGEEKQGNEADKEEAEKEEEQMEMDPYFAWQDFQCWDW